ncbi:DUF1566 domain-containing protein [Thalassotalea crassostreae]|uniref:Lcl C-terminal domain-containing protein n=1 Tax=Thalassotalea crassostreae TaxID=1763536 RepID=UPI000838655C|nr:DUF1566 domain-containing protein [Thalassotalea crassostreae]
MKNLKLKTLVASSLVLLSTSAMAQRGEAETNQSCMYNITQSAPTDRYRINTGGATVHDKVTGLTWSRCDLGETWNEESAMCIGTKSEVNWLEAAEQATNYEAGGLTGWRLPNIKELSTLTEDRCFLPAMNVEVFNNLVGWEAYFSATPFIFDDTDTKVMIFSVRLSEVLAYSKDNQLNVKYVRD